MLGKVKPVSRPWWVAGMLVVVAVAGLLRLWMPGPTVVTVDEPDWRARSGLFLEALLDGRFEDTVSVPIERLSFEDTEGSGSDEVEAVPQPGVTTMWIGAAAELVHERSLPVLGAGDQLKVGKQLMGMVCALLLVPFVVSSSRLIGRRGALVAGGVLAVEPMAVGLSALLHTDGLMTMAWAVMAVSLLAAFDESRRYLGLKGAPTVSWWRSPALRLGVLAGAAGGLAFLTKAAALVPMGALAGLALVIHVGLVLRTHRSVGLLLRSLVPTVLVPVLSAAVVLLLLWPALWADPRGSFEIVVRSVSLVDVEAHRFLLGELVVGRDWRYYPVEMVFRSSAWLLLLIPIAVGWKVWARSQRHHPVMSRRNTAALLGAGIVYYLAISSVELQFGRFLLPLLPLAALALGAVAEDGVRVVSYHYRRERRPVPTFLLPGVGLAVLAVGAYMTFGLAPYQISHVNQLVGGQMVARDNVLLGWGEGTEKLLERYLEDDCASWATTSWDVEGPWAAGCPTNRRSLSFVDGVAPPPKYVFRHLHDRQLGREPEGLLRYLRANGRRVRHASIGDVVYSELWVIDSFER